MLSNLPNSSNYDQIFTKITNLLHRYPNGCTGTQIFQQIASQIIVDSLIKHLNAFS